jgi:hypothetical protein
MVRLLAKHHFRQCDLFRDRSVAASSVGLYPVQLPEPRIDGVMFQRSTKLLRIDE